MNLINHFDPIPTVFFDFFRMRWELNGVTKPLRTLQNVSAIVKHSGVGLCTEEM